MLVDKMIAHGIGERNGFRWRSHEISRIEGLSDAVFAFAVTLLVVSLEVPKNFDELAESMRGFLAFGISFTMLASLWYAQYKFFRRYGLQDRPTVLLNLALLFVVLFYVYPLKFLFSVLIAAFSGHTEGVRFPDGAAGVGVRTLEGHVVPVLRDTQWPTLMLVYGLGFVAVYVVFALLYLHAWRRRASLQLTATEAFDTLNDVGEHALMTGVGLASVAIVTLSPRHAMWSGWVYGLIPVVMTAHGFLSRVRRRKHEVAAASAAAPVVPVEG